MAKAKVAVINTSPQTVLEDYKKLLHLADYQSYLPKDTEIALKINISWYYFYPACSTTFIALRQQAENTTYCTSLIFLLMILISPISWRHHYTFTLFPLAFLMKLIIEKKIYVFFYLSSQASFSSIIILSGKDSLLTNCLFWD